MPRTNSPRITVVVADGLTADAATASCRQWYMQLATRWALASRGDVITAFRAAHAAFARESLTVTPCRARRGQGVRVTGPASLLAKLDVA